MSRFTPQVQSLLGGQNDRSNATGLPLGQHEKVRNVRFNEGVAARRPGMKRLDRVTETGDCLLLTSGYVRIPVHDVHQLPLAWTIDIVIRPTDVPTTTGGTGQILGFVGGEDAFTVSLTSTGLVRFTTTDTDSTQFSLESLTAVVVDDALPIRITRNGSVLTLRLSDTVVASRSDLDATKKSVAPTTDLLVGSANVGTGDEWPFEGYVDDLRIFHVFLEGQKHAWMEWPDPRYPGMVAYYRFNSSATGLVQDESRYGNHGLTHGNCVFATPGLVSGLEPVVGIHQYQHSSGTRKVLLAAGEQFFTSTVV